MIVSKQRSQNIESCYNFNCLLVLLLVHCGQQRGHGDTAKHPARRGGGQEELPALRPRLAEPS